MLFSSMYRPPEHNEEQGHDVWLDCFLCNRKAGLSYYIKKRFAPLFYIIVSKTVFKSSIISSTSSNPMESLTNVSLMPPSALSSGV